MNKADFVSAVSDAAGLTKVDGAKAVEAFMETVKKAQSAHWGTDQDQGLEESIIQGWQSAQGCHKLTRFRPVRA
jgi:hypothetical protein